ncbi:hypothetical protein D3C80_1206550 [compost metagenome]
MVGALDAFDVVETAHRNGIRAIGQAPQHSRHGQANVASIIAVAKCLPLDVLGAIKVVGDVLDGSHVFHRLLAKERRPHCTDEWHVRRRCDFRNITKKGDILRAAIELVVGNGRGDRLSTRRIVFLSVGMHVQTALGNLWRILKILHQVILADIQQFNAYILTKIGLIDQRLHAPPRRLNALKICMVHHCIELTADLPIQ